MKQIPIYGKMPHGGDTTYRRARAKIVAYAIVDDDMYEPLSKFMWCLTSRRGGCVDRTRYAVANINGRRVRMHHMVVIMPVGDLHVSHKNSNALDNRRENLELVTKAENLLNPNDGVYRNSQSGIRNVRKRVLKSGEIRYVARVRRMEGHYRLTEAEAIADAVELRAQALAMARSGTTST